MVKASYRTLTPILGLCLGNVPLGVDVIGSGTHGSEGKMKRLSLLIAGIALGVVAIEGQQILSLRPGTVHYVEGEATVDGRALEIHSGRFPTVPVGGLVATGRGRLELLLTPGAIARLGEFSQLRLPLAELSAVRLDLLQGRVSLEVLELPKGTRLTVSSGGSEISVRKAGFYQFTAEPFTLKVYEGQAELLASSPGMKIGRGRMAQWVDGDWVIGKFNRKEPDRLYQWSAARSEVLARANLQAARMLYENRSPWRYPGWCWDASHGYLTYIPRSGLLVSPFGFMFYSPRSVMYADAPVRSSSTRDWPSASGRAEDRYAVVDHRPAPYPGGGVPSVAAEPAAGPAPSPRSAGTESPRAGGGRGR